MRILVLEHERDAPAGLLAEWALDRGHELTTLAVPDVERWPDPRGADSVVSLGSDCSVHASPELWIGEEVAFLRRAHAAGVPLLGICFGAQALARALGGEVKRGPALRPEWTVLDSADPDLMPAGPWFRWHEDTFTIPPGARELGRLGQIPLAFSLGASVGVQFHPEVTAEIAHGWVRGLRRQLAESNIDEAMLHVEIDSRADGSRERALDLFDRIHGLWGAPAAGV